MTALSLITTLRKLSESNVGTIPQSKLEDYLHVITRLWDVGSISFSMLGKDPNPIPYSCC